MSTPGIYHKLSRVCCCEFYDYVSVTFQTLLPAIAEFGTDSLLSKVLYSGKPCSTHLVQVLRPGNLIIRPGCHLVALYSWKEMY